MFGQKGKAPTVQWYFRDWLTDKQLARAEASTRGIWIDLLMYMLDCPLDDPNCTDGQLNDMRIKDIMVLGRCSEDQAWQFVEDAVHLKFCDIEVDKHRTFHIKSRRLSRDMSKRRKWREQKRKQREKEDSPKEVHPNVSDLSNQCPSLSSISTSTSTSNKDNKDKKNTSSDDEEKEQFYITKKKKKLTGKRLETFNIFWDNFNYKQGKAEAADAWLEIYVLNSSVVDKILEAAQLEAQRRPKLKRDGKTPKMAQGWLSGRRWEDEIYKPQKQGESWRDRISKTQ